MTFIPAAVCSSYRGCEKTFVIPKARVNFIPRSGRVLLYRKGSRKVPGESRIRWVELWAWLCRMTYEGIGIV